jgi:hypothetical protein
LVAGGGLEVKSPGPNAEDVGAKVGPGENFVDQLLVEERVVYRLGDVHERVGIANKVTAGHGVEGGESLRLEGP